MNTHSVIGAVASLVSVAAHAQLTVQSTFPTLNQHNVARDTAVSVTFDRAVDRATFVPANFYVFGKLIGPVPGAYSFSNGDRTVTFTPSRTFLAGETALLVMSKNLRAADASALRAAGYTVMFTTAAAPSPGVFRQYASISDRDESGNQTRIYGGVACDLNHDGWADLTLVNEVSADLRVFLNRADGTGLFHPMEEPPTPIPYESSPNEVADFNGDGLIDMVTSSYSENKIALCFGDGAGHFPTTALIDVGATPRGFGIIDADGDGDLDITVACAGGNRIFYLRSNGNGTFAPPTSFEGGVNGEYGMTAADMNNDGILDLVVGGVNNGTVAVCRGNGNGTFTQTSVRSIGGNNWVIACADLNNDGKMDVSAANSHSANGSILLGNGDGTLQPAMVMPTDGHTVSTDLADLDGDGDPDWILSAFGAGRWYLYENNGAGQFTLQRQVFAPNNPSCATPVDLDNDNDIDLVLTDEIADVMMLMENYCPGDFDDDGFITGLDYDAFVQAYESGDKDADFDGDGFITGVDFDQYVAAYEAGC